MMLANIGVTGLAQWLEEPAQYRFLRALVWRSDFHNPRMPQSVGSGMNPTPSAAAMLNKMTERLDFQSEALLLRADALRSTGDFERARQHYRHLLDKGALPGAWHGLGLIAAGMTDPMKVRAFLDLAGAWDPSLALVMGAAIAVAASFWLSQRLARRLCIQCRAPADIPTLTNTAA